MVLCAMYWRKQLNKALANIGIVTCNGVLHKQLVKEVAEMLPHESNI